MGGDLGGGVEAAPEMGGDKPFDDEPFDAGVEADEEGSPKEYIQQLSGKLGQSLRKYEKEMGTPDLELEKFAVNSVLSATNTAEMDAEDQKDIIDKVKTSGLENDIEPEADAEAPAEPAPDGGEEVDVNVDAEAPELGETTLDEFGGGPPEDREYDAMQAYRERQGNTYPSSVDSGNAATKILAKHLGLDGDNPKKSGSIAENLRRELSEGLFPNKRSIKSDRGYLGVTVWGDSGSVSLDLYSYQNNPYGGSPWKQIQSGGGVRPEEFTKEFIMKNVSKRYQKPDNFYDEADELLTKLNGSYDKMMQDMNPEIAEPEVQPKRETEQPKRIKERDLPFRKPVRETKTKPKAQV